MGSRAGAALTAGAAYFALIFAAGFALGVVRELALRPWTGDLGAVLIELPVILLAAYFAARWLARRFSLGRTSDRMVMGAVALTLLLAAEAALAGPVRGLSLFEWAAGFASLRGAVTLTGYAGFAAMPVWAGGRGRAVRGKLRGDFDSD